MARPVVEHNVCSCGVPQVTLDDLSAENEVPLLALVHVDLRPLGPRREVDDPPAHEISGDKPTANDSRSDNHFRKFVNLLRSHEVMLSVHRPNVRP